ncbi:PIN-like domain-containing protein [Aureimonas phyllosphaerae]|uniref:PIN like domain-containing protein n=1 Tax=Aureimonas phyllosphaerae TaxID=1166078 RepID=A0A7W6C2E7_9HYPH|nr:PIN-like domain-containing protein [Aureimonas phyllosphaerae]MBB3937227.1 hypothetical protein [Aureimonas phyllosphaerae]MBB3961136.1 hypothetical protein [Aureimonas phyllosphaerae]SFF49171.1 hypothetical protein SAMN05216566_11755 [Aureimonas phyllosphaerae]
MRSSQVGRRPPQIDRSRVAPIWSGPLVGRKPEPVEAYLKRIADLTTDERTHFYLDASFLMWMAKVGKEARDEFFGWQAHVGSSRFHVPLWAAHEFHKHRIKGTVSTELKSEIRAFDVAAGNVYEKLRVYRSDQMFGFKGSGSMFLDEFRRTVQPLRSMLKLVERSTHVEASVQDVADYVDARLLSGPLHEVIADIDHDEIVRNRGSLPPGFKDAHKRTSRGNGGGSEQTGGDDNSFGDLAFWREVLRHAGRLEAAATVILTADRKNDWFENHHGHAGLPPDVHKRLGRPKPIPAPHPLLTREAFDRGAGCLVLLDPMYCAVVVERSGRAADNLASAALDINLPESEKKQKAVLGWARRFGAEARLLGEVSEFAPSPDEDDTAAAEYEEFDPALLDIDLLKAAAVPGEPAASVVAGLATGDAATRTAMLVGLDLERLESWDPAALVALGRATFDAAERGDAAALGFVSRLRDDAPALPPAVRDPLYFGALSALYLDDRLDMRTPSGSALGLMLLGLATTPEGRAPATALGDLLNDGRLLHRPGDVGMLEIEVLAKPSADNKAPADLQAIKMNGRDLITTLQVDEKLRFARLLGEPGGIVKASVGSLLEIVARFHLLPLRLIKTETNLDVVVAVPEFAGIELDR